MKRCILLIALLSIVMGRSCTEQKVTIDPNTLDAQVAPTQQEADDRLAEKVTYTADGKAVRAILADLTELTGVKFYAGYNAGDWQVRDRRMRILVKDLPLAHLMNSMARVMKFKWSCSKEKDIRSYRLYADRESLSEEQRLLKRWERLREELPRRQIESALKAFEGLKSRYEEDPDALRKENAVLYAYAKSGAGDTVLRLCKDIPGLREALLSGRQVTFRGPELPDSTLDDLPRIVQSFAAFGLMSAFDPNMFVYMCEGRPTADEMRDFPVDRESALVWANRLRNEVALNDDSWPAWIPADILAGCRDGAWMWFLMLAPDSRFWQLSTQETLEAREKGLDPYAYFGTREDEQAAALREDIEKFHTGEPMKPRPKGGVLDEEIKLGNDEESDLFSLADYQNAIATACPVRVVSDSFPDVQMPSFPGSPSTMRALVPVSGKRVDILEAICTGFDYNCDYADGVLEFRDRYWFAKRAQQVSDAWLDKWRTKIKNDVTLDIADLAEIAALSRRQIVTNLQPDEDLRGLAGHSAFRYDYEILHLYAVLTESQRQQLLTDAGLDVRTLAPHQAECLEAIRTHLLEPDNVISMLAPAGYPGTLAKLTQEDVVSESGMRSHDFTLTNTDGERVGWWTVNPYPNKDLERELRELENWERELEEDLERQFSSPGTLH